MAEIVSLPINPDFSSSRGGIPHASVENFRRLLRAHGITIRYNEVRKEMDVFIPNKEYLPDNYLNCCEAEIVGIAAGYRMPTGNIFKFMKLIADENSYNPAVDWIESKPWDGRSRLLDFYETIESTNESLKNVLMQRWMVSAVAACYEPNGVSAGGMLVLVGKQYLGKTNWFKNLVPEKHNHLIADGMSIDPRNRDSLMPCLERWLVELGEIDSTFKRSDLSALKAFINKRQDVARMAYGAANSRFPRRTVFFGSVDKRTYLTDPAGNRRFWTVECSKINHSHGLDMQQVWAEFKVLYDNKEPWLLTPDEHELLREANEEFEAIEPMLEKLLKKYDWDLPLGNWKTATDVLEEIGWHGKPTKSDTTRCGNEVRKLNGGVSKKTARGRLLSMPPTRIYP